MLLLIITHYKCSRNNTEQFHRSISQSNQSIYTNTNKVLDPNSNNNNNNNNKNNNNMNVIRNNREQFNRHKSNQDNNKVDINNLMREKKRKEIQD